MEDFDLPMNWKPFKQPKDKDTLRRSLEKQVLENTKNFGIDKINDKIIKRANELVNVFWFNTQLSAKHCASIHCRRIIEELNHHSDLHGYYQDEDGCQSIIERIEFYKKVIDQIEERW